MTRLKLLSVLPILLISFGVSAPTITTQPTNQTAVAPAPATFSVVAKNNSFFSYFFPLKYQWYGNGGAISGATKASYTVTPTTLAMNGSLFKVLASSGNQQTASGTVTLTVVAAAQKITINATTTLPQATVGTAYSANIGTAANVQLNGGACTGCSYSISSGTAPAGLTLSTAGVLAGTPTATVTAASFTVLVTAPSGAKKKIQVGKSATH